MEKLMERLVTVSGPRGAGKGITVEHLLKQFLELPRLVNFTTRAPRLIPKETDGVEYQFISVDVFLTLRNTGKLACWSQIGEDDDPKKYYNGITKAEMEKYPIGIVDKAVKSARKLETYAEKTLKLYIFATEEERLGRLVSGRGLSLEEAQKEIAKEPSPGHWHELGQLYPDFMIIENHDGQQALLFAQAIERVVKFLNA